MLHSPALVARSREPVEYNPMTMKLARFLAEVSVRSPSTSGTEGQDPALVILDRVRTSPHSDESRALIKGCLAVIECEGDMSEADLRSLGMDALGLLDRFATERLRLRYPSQDLRSMADRLKRVAN